MVLLLLESGRSRTLHECATAKGDSRLENSQAASGVHTTGSAYLRWVVRDHCLFGLVVSSWGGYGCVRPIREKAE